MWPASMTSERPLRSSSSLPSMPVLMTPISALTMKMPPNVVTQHREQEPERPCVAAHGARVERAQERVPDGGLEIPARAAFAPREVQEPHHDRDREDDQRRHGEQPDDERDRPAPEEIVERVAHALTE